MLATTFLAAIILTANVNGNNVDERGGPGGIGFGGGSGNGMGADSNGFGNSKPIPISIWGPWPAPKTPLPESRSSSAQPPVSQTSLPHATFESSLDSSATSEGSSPEKTSSYVQTSFPTSTLAALAQTVPSFSLQAPPSASPSIPTPTSASQLPPFSPPVVTLSSAITVMPIPQNPAGFVAGETSSIHIGSHSHPKAIMSGEGTTSNAGSSVVATTTAKLAPSVTGAGENVKIIWKSLLLLEVVVVVVGLF